MLYGCGLRVSEPLNLRIKDIDLERQKLWMRGAKGGNDRVVPLPASLASETMHQMQVARMVWKVDKQNATPVMLPHRLARKYPEYRFSWGCVGLGPNGEVMDGAPTWVGASLWTSIAGHWTLCRHGAG